MKRILLCLLLTVPLWSCGKDNSSTVEVVVDANRCLVSVGGYDWTEESRNRFGVRSVNYRWECADYVSPFDGRRYEKKRVTRTFVTTVCDQLTSEIVGVGYCIEGQIPGL